MTLLVPTSNADPGRAARPALVETPETGTAFARLGLVATEVGTRLENDRLDRQMKRLQVDMTRDLNDLSLEVAQIGDPDLADQAWETRLAEIRQGYDAAGPDGRPRVDPKNAEAFGLAFDDLAHRHAFSLGRRTLALRQAEREATFLAYSHEAARSGATGGPEVRQELLQIGYEQIDDALARGDIDAAEAQRRKIRLAEDIDTASAIRMVAEDPAALIERLDAGELDGLSGDQAARFRVAAGAALEAEAEAAAREAEKAQTAREKEIGDQLAEIRAVAGKGLPSKFEAMMADPEVKAHPDFAKTEGALALRGKKVRYEQMSPAQLEALIAANENKPIGEAWEAGEIEALREALADHEAAYARDPIGHALEVQPIAVPELPEFDPARPAAFTEGLRLRLDAAEELVRQGYADEVVAFSAGDKAALSAVLKSTTDPGAKLALAKSLAEGLGPQARTQARGLTDDPVFDWTVALAGAGVPDATLRDMLSGQGRIADKTVRVPGRGDATTAFHEITGGAFSDLPETTRGVMSAALALYAEDNPGAENDDFSVDAFRPYVNRALGGDGERGGIQKIDPIGHHNTYDLPLPPGVSARAVQTSLNAIGEDLAFRADVGGRRAAVSLDRLTAASLRGAAPDFGDPSADGYDPGSIFAQFHLEPVWANGVPTDRYIFVRRVGGADQVLRDSNGDHFEVSLRRMIRGAAR